MHKHNYCFPLCSRMLSVSEAEAWLLQLKGKNCHPFLELGVFVIAGVLLYPILLQKFTIPQKSGKWFCDAEDKVLFHKKKIWKLFSEETAWLNQLY